MGTPDLAEFFRLSQPKRSPCQVGYVRTQLSEQDIAALDAAVATDKGIITAGAIHQWLVARGHDVSHQRIVNHRLGKCSCHD